MGESNDKGTLLIEHNITLPNLTYYLQPRYCLQPTTYNLPPTTYYLPPNTYYLLPTSYHLQPTYFLQPTY